MKVPGSPLTKESAPKALERDSEGADPRSGTGPESRSGYGQGLEAESGNAKQAGFRRPGQLHGLAVARWLVAGPWRRAQEPRW
jgi:hypothetical protein